MLGFSFIDNLLFEHLGGPGNPDFVGRGILSGMSFDITTTSQISSHLARSYGISLTILTYLRDIGFTLFP